MIPDGAMMADLVMLSAVAPLSLSPKSNISLGLVFGGAGQLPQRIVVKRHCSLSRFVIIDPV